MGVLASQVWRTLKKTMCHSAETVVYHSGQVPPLATIMFHRCYRGCPPFSFHCLTGCTAFIHTAKLVMFTAHDVAGAARSTSKCKLFFFFF